MLRKETSSTPQELALQGQLHQLDAVVAPGQVQDAQSRAGGLLPGEWGRQGPEAVWSMCATEGTTTTCTACWFPAHSEM